MAKKTEKTVKKQPTAGSFKKGQSGNPKGKPKGCLSKATRAMKLLLDGEMENLTRACIEKAMDGDMTAMRLCLERIAPPVKELPVEFKLPSVSTAEKLSKATAKILREVAAGNLTVTQGEGISRLLSHHQKALEIADLEARIKALEEAANNGVK